jgi:diguanylate cyclase (GGDEF)-like protein
VLVVAALGLLLALLAVAALIIDAQEGSRQQLRANLGLRAGTSAQLVGTYISQQAHREQLSAERLLSSPRVSPARFQSLADAFGATFAVLLDSRGRALATAPHRSAVIGQDIAERYQAGQQALRGALAVSGVVPVAGSSASVAAVAAPYRAQSGALRVFAAAYRVGGGELQALVDHASTTRGHEVFLTDADGNVLAASPRTSQSVLANADPALASVVERGSHGSLHDGAVASTFASARVPGTSWRILIDVPDSSLYATTGGLAGLAPWLAFALLALLAVLLLGVLARLLADRTRLAELSDELAGIARTDPLTGLLNRRGIEEGFAKASARSRRRGEALTVLMIDLDGFKQVNDRHGHEAGDGVLRALAGCMRDVLRSEDVYGRIGGDEFIAVLSDPDGDAGAQAAQRLRLAAAGIDLGSLGIDGGIALSIGIASGLHVGPEDLMRAADAELYRVKGERRASAAAL